MPTEISGSTGVNKIQDGTVVNADINNSAAIAGSKLVMPAGSIVQVKTDQVLSSTTISNSNTWTGIGLSVDITPKSASNHMIILCSCATYCDSNDQTSGLTVFRDSTNLGYSVTGISPFYMNWGGGTEDLQVTSPIVYYDELSTTSEVTYEVKGKADKSNYRINGLRQGIAQLIVMEVAG